MSVNFDSIASDKRKKNRKDSHRVPKRLHSDTKSDVIVNPTFALIECTEDAKHPPKSSRVGAAYQCVLPDLVQTCELHTCVQFETEYKYTKFDSSYVYDALYCPRDFSQRMSEMRIENAQIKAELRLTQKHGKRRRV